MMNALRRMMAGAMVVVLGLAGAAHGELIAYWTLDNTAVNSVPDGPVGDLVGGAGYSAAQTAPGTGSTHALSTDGTAGRQFEVPSSADRTRLSNVMEGEFTVSLWARANAAAAGQGSDLRYMFEFGAGHGSGVGVAFNDSHVTFGGDTDSIGYYYTNNGVDTGVAGNANTWYHVVMVRRGNDTKVYVGGTEEGTTTELTPNISTSYPFVLAGQAKSDGRNWNGYIDEVAIWDRALSDTEIQSLANATVQPGKTDPVMGDKWVFEDEGFNSTQGSAGVGPWRDNARWRYKTNSTVTDHVYDTSTITEFPDLGTFVGSQWQQGAVNYPSVRISDDTIHPGGPAGSDNNADVVVAWEADFSGFVSTDYRVYGGNSIGYQLLQWDASAGQMRVLQQRRTYNGGDSGTLTARTRVEAGDQILFVYDGRGNGNNDRGNYRQTVSLSSGPQVGDSWDFAGDAFNDSSLSSGAGPWSNSARWRYMYTSLTSGFTSPGDFTDFPNFGGNEWKLSDSYPSVRISDMAMHAGDTNAVLAWEADFAHPVEYEFAPSKYYSGTSVQYQLLWWNASAGIMIPLHVREVLDAGELPITGIIHAGIGDMLFFVLDNSTGDYGSDRINMSAEVSIYIPEPGTMTLLALGGIGLLRRRRRRR